jgi:hypothetical protein
MNNSCRACWQNCGVEADAEMLEIDGMEDTMAPLDEQTTRIRALITRYEACYHEADKEAERIVKAIGAGRCPAESDERPPERKKELENCCRLLSQWCENPSIRDINLDVGDIHGGDMLSFIGPATPLKIWQVQRVIDRITFALNPNQPYHNMVLDLGDYGEPGANPAGEHYKDSVAFLEQTKETIIHDTVDGHQAKMSLAMAVDLLFPCHWDFPGAVATILKAIGGDLRPERPYTCCARNLRLSPLCGRVRIISNTLGAFWKEEDSAEDIDAELLASLGAVTAEKCWLAASLDKTIRLQLEAPPDFWLTFSW